MTLMQKAITPALSRAHLEDGYDRMAGYVVRAEDVAFATTPAQLFEVHGLGYPGSPFRPDAHYIDLLRFESGPQLQYRDVPGYIVPLWWLRHSRITPGAELVRVFSDGSATLLARYGDVGTGWSATHLGHRPALASLSRCVGPVAKWHSAYLEADVVDGGQTVVLALANPPLAETGFHQAPSGRWFRRVPREDVSELFELDLTARWNGLAVRVVDQWQDAQRYVVARISHLGDDLDHAEHLRLDRVEAGVYESVVYAAELTDIQTNQVVPHTWSPGPSRALRRPVTTQSYS
ncbi:hypothetical protein [Cellulomonas palmilytica]|uniref:hypothetical protein n=1 Tax=Cellulomonas palmilytica TaxID=2608402 RepID=UPI001F26789F|nr:hypothetical protein [Cellulomonas palmilytica]UJP40485.1 hypothetical protein F1D97_02895 [Cellulomonas palmilytica]